MNAPTYKITDGRIKFGQKTINGYKKKDVLVELQNVLLKNNLKHSLYFSFELFMSGHFKDLWELYFLIMVEYIHVLNPDLPLYMNTYYTYYQEFLKKIKNNKIDVITIRNSYKIQKIIFTITKNICKSKKKHISYFIRQTYNNQVEIKNAITLKKSLRDLFKLINVVFKKKLKNKGCSDTILDEIFINLGRLISYNCLSLRTVGYPYNINLYHHQKNNKNFKKVTDIIWNHLLNNSIKNIYILKQIKSLKQIYEYNLLHKAEKQSFIFIQCIMYIIYTYKSIMVEKYDTKYDNIIRMHYDNTQNALNTKTQRSDYIELNDEYMKIKKIKEKRKNELSKQKNEKQNIQKLNTRVENRIDKIIQKDKVFSRKIIDINKISDKINDNKYEELKREVEISENESGNSSNKTGNSPENNAIEPSFEDLFNLIPIQKITFEKIDKNKQKGNPNNEQEKLLGLLNDFDNIPYREDRRVYNNIDITNIPTKKLTMYKKENNTESGKDTGKLL